MHPDSPLVEVDVGSGEGRDLAPPQRGERLEQDERTPPVGHEAGERLQLLERQHRAFGGTFLPRSSDPARVDADQLVLGQRRVEDGAQQAVRLGHHRGRRAVLQRRGAPLPDHGGVELSEWNPGQPWGEVAAVERPVDVGGPRPEPRVVGQPLFGVRPEENFAAGLKPSAADLGLSLELGQDLGRVSAPGVGDGPRHPDAVLRPVADLPAARLALPEGAEQPPRAHGAPALPRRQTSDTTAASGPVDGSRTVAKESRSSGWNRTNLPTLTWRRRRSEAARLMKRTETLR